MMIIGIILFLVGSVFTIISKGAFDDYNVICKNDVSQDHIYGPKRSKQLIELIIGIVVATIGLLIVVFQFI